MAQAWPEDSNGAEANEKSARSVGGLRSQELRKQLPPDYAEYKDVPTRNRRQQVNRIKGAYQHATPDQQRVGTRWYQHAHVQAAELANNIPYHVDRPMDRATAAIARLSPSGGGMNWARNVPAAHEANALSDKQVGQVAKGNRSSLAGKNLKHAANADVATAHGVLHGSIDPEDALTTKKIGHFYMNIRHPQGGGPQGAHGEAVRAAHPSFYKKVDDAGATVDGRADSILKGYHVPWGSDIGLTSSQGRYDYENSVYKQASKEIGVRAHAGQATVWTVGEEAGKGKKRKAHEKLDYTSLDNSKPVLHQPAQFGRARMAQGQVPRSVMHPGTGPLGAN